MTRGRTDALVRYELQEQVAVITLDRPERHNALVPELIADLRASIAAASRDERCRCVVLASAGPNFSTGGDVAAFAEHTGPALRRYAREIVGSLHEAVLDLLRLPVPTVVATPGVVTGGSLGLVLACDMVVAGEDASFAPWYVQVGFSPDGGWTALLPDRVGRSRAAWWQLTNQTVDAATALAWGLVNEVHTDPRGAAMAVAHRVSRMKPAAVARTTRLLRPSIAAVRAGLDAETESFAEQVVTAEARLGMREFLDHRTPTQAGPSTARRDAQ